MEYMVRKVTFERLQAALNAFGGEGWACQVIFAGGRDYVVVCSRAGEDEPASPRSGAAPKYSEPFG